MKRLLFVLLAGALVCTTVNAQGVKTPAPSPTVSMKQDFGLSSIELSYSRPAKKGRVIFGDLVPFGKVWRTGANGATTLTFGDDVTIGGTSIKAGKYGLLSIPGATEWTLIITKQTNVTSPSAYKQEEDVVRVKVKPMALPKSIENFTIEVGNIKAALCELWLMWDKTVVSLPIATEVDSKVMAQIDEAMKSDNPPYFAAAAYYLENNKDLNKALEWFTIAADKDPNAYWISYQKAKCLAKLGKKADAITTAKASMAKAEEQKNPDYVKLNADLIKSLAGK